MRPENSDDQLKWMGRDYKVEKDHPYPDFMPNGIKTLIIGSFPSKASKYFDFFYGSKMNRFWPIIEGVYGHEFEHKRGSEAVREREDFLRTKLIGLTDIITQCYRHRDRSGDESLFPISLKNIPQVLDEHRSITRLVFTGRQYIIGPLGLFITSLYQQRMELEEFHKDDLKNLIGVFYYGDRKIEIMVPYSPSARFAERSDYDFQHMIKMYKRCLSI